MKKLKFEEIMYSIVGSAFAVIMLGGIIQELLEPSVRQLIVISFLIFIISFFIFILMNLDG